MHRLILWAVNVALYVRHPRLVLIFWRRVGYFPNIAAPTRRSERLFWRKVFDHNPEFVTVSDKAAAKQWIRDRSPEIDPIETLWTGTDPHRIDPTLLAEPTILKATHGSRYNMALPGGIDPAAIDKTTTDAWLAETYGLELHEWAYHGISPMLILEPHLGDGSVVSVTDLAFHTTNGEPVIVVLLDEIKTDAGRKGYFRPDGRRWSELESPGARYFGAALEPHRELPECTDVAMRMARSIGAPFDYARVDFFIADGVPHVGEVTIYPAAGLMNAAGYAGFDAVLNEAWDLRTAWFFSTQRTGLLGVYQRAVFAHLERDARRRTN